MKCKTGEGQTGHQVDAMAAAAARTTEENSQKD